MVWIPAGRATVRTPALPTREAAVAPRRAAHPEHRRVPSRRCRPPTGAGPKLGEAGWTSPMAVAARGGPPAHSSARVGSPAG